MKPEAKGASVPVKSEKKGAYVPQPPKDTVQIPKPTDSKLVRVKKFPVSKGECPSMMSFPGVKAATSDSQASYSTSTSSIEN